MPPTLLVDWPNSPTCFITWSPFGSVSRPISLPKSGRSYITWVYGLPSVFFNCELLTPDATSWPFELHPAASSAARASAKNFTVSPFVLVCTGRGQTIRLAAGQRSEEHTSELQSPG